MGSYVANLERRFELRIEVDRLLHGIVVQLMCEHDGAFGVECALGHVVYQQVVGRVNGSGGDIVKPDTPVVRVILPNDGLQTERMCD
jgi:hypothetical protein